MQAPNKPTRSADIKTRILPDGHVVLYSEKSNWAHTLTPVGALVWEFCDGESSIDQIISQITALQEIEAGPAAVESEIRDLIRELEENGLLLGE